MVTNKAVTQEGAELVLKGLSAKKTRSGQLNSLRDLQEHLAGIAPSVATAQAGATPSSVSSIAELKTALNADLEAFDPEDDAQGQLDFDDYLDSVGSVSAGVEACTVGVGVDAPAEDEIEIKITVKGKNVVVG